MGSTDVASLAIRIESLEVATAKGRLNDLTNAGGRAERATDGLAGSFKRLIGPLAASITAAATLGKLVSTQREFDVLNASLITATGSTEEAGKAFEALQQFAAKTPYDLAQVTESFTKLVNMGLTPSERALMSYGNTAAAMGKDMNQLIEAVADAATGEFERLKEFGIKASQNGDRVSLTFRGVKTEIGNNAAEIEQYLMALGENEFAGAMTERMNSLDGAISNLGDAWDQMFLQVSQSGVGDLIETGVRAATSAIEDLTAYIASGQMEQHLLAIGASFGSFGSGIMEDLGRTADYISQLFKETAGEGKSFGSVVFETLQVLAINTVYVLKQVGNEIGGIAAQLAALATGDFAGFKRIGEMMKEDAIAARKEVDALSEAVLNPKTGKDATSGYEKHMEEARRLREKYDREREAKAKELEDRLAKYGKGGSATGGVDKAAEKAAAAAEKKRQAEFEKLVESLRTEEEAIAESYAKRKAIIDGSTAPESTQRSDLTARLDKEHSDQLKKLAEQRGAELEGLRASLRTEEEVIQESYDRRLQIIHDNTADNFQLRGEMESRLEAERDKALAGLEEQRQREKDSLYSSLMSEEEALLHAYERKRTAILESEAVTETERQDLLRRLKQQFDEEQAAAEMQRLQMQLGNAENLFSGLAGIAKSYAGEQSKEYRALFAVSKAFAVAQAGLSIKTGIAKAMELGWPAGLAAAAAAAAQGAQILAQINGENFAGAFDQGGQIPAGKIGLVGEYGPELVRGPASVKGRELTARELRKSEPAAQAAPPVVNVRNINVLDPSVVGDYLGSDDGEQLIMNVVQRNQRALGG